jgi:hypothetical protein
MKKSAIFSVSVAFMVACGSGDKAPAINTSANQPANQAGGTASIQWLDSVRNFGSINEGQKLSVSFGFKNTGTAPLIIESVQPACGCTVADYPKQPIAAGGEGEITGAFESQGRPGHQHKTISVVANTTQRKYTLAFDVDVKPAKEQQAN